VPPSVPPPTEPGGDEATLSGSSMGEVLTHGSTGGVGSFQAPPEPGERIGTFVVQRVLGSGAMGVVLLAHDPELDRPVAIKLLAPKYGRDERAQQRLLREAQAIAKLSHPNVVAVFQAGTHGDRVYVVMEMVDGGTLRQWVRAQPRSWAEIVHAYEQAAFGLAAAHAAGLVHRDFKPDNVLIGRDGRVRVSDFGLVAGTGGPPSGPSGTLVAGADSRLTETGTVMGTPAYMAPEQLSGQPVDPRADQFAFCVSLWEALHGERPFAGEHALAVYAAIEVGAIRPPRRTDLPAPLHAAIVRGLSCEPAGRHRSMVDLAAELRRALGGRAQGRGWLVAALAGAAVLLAAGVGLATLWPRGEDEAPGSPTLVAAEADPPKSRCSGPDPTLGGRWQDDVQARMDAAFAATGLASSSDRAGRARAAIEVYASAIGEARHARCVASETVDVTIDPAVEAARERCLHEAEVHLVAVIDLLSEPMPREVADSAAAIVAGLPQPAACDDVAFLKARPVPPVHAERDAWLGRFRRGFAALQVERYDDASAHATFVTDAAEAAGDAALSAEALVLRGHARRLAGDAATAEADLVRAIERAQAARDPLAELHARRERLALIAGTPGRAAAAKALVDGLLEAQARAHARFEAWEVHAALAELHATAGEPAAALEAMDAVIEGLEALPIPRPDQLGLAHVFRGALLQNAGRVIEAEAEYRLGMGVQVASLGVDHASQAAGLERLVGLLQQLGRGEEMLSVAEQWVAVLEGGGIAGVRMGQALAMLGWAHHVRADHAAAKDAYTRALALLEADPAMDRVTAGTAMRLGEVELMLGNVARAEELLSRAREMARRHPDIADPIGAEAHELLGTIAAARGDAAAARRHYADALAVRERLFGPGPEVVEAHLLVAELDVATGACRAATEHLDAAAQIQGSAAARRDDLLVRTSLAQAQCAMETSDFEGAERSLDEASDRVGRGGLDPMLAANVKLVRAKLHDRQGDRAEALRIATEARDDLVALGPTYAAQVRVAEAFVAAYDEDP
jgi:tetratricopeptide (TPR) repeat protein